MAIRTLVLSPGDCAILPKGARIDSVVVDGDGQVTSTCGNLPAPTGYACYRFLWQHISEDMDSSTFTELIIGDNTYTVPTAYSPYNNLSGVLTNETLLGDWIEADPALAGIVLFNCDSGALGGNYELNIKVPEGLPIPKLIIKNPTAGDDAFFTLEATLDEDCSNCP